MTQYMHVIPPVPYRKFLSKHPTVQTSVEAHLLLVNDELCWGPLSFLGSFILITVSVQHLR